MEIMVCMGRDTMLLTPSRVHPVVFEQGQSVLDMRAVGADDIGQTLFEAGLQLVIRGCPKVGSSNLRTEVNICRYKHFEEQV